MRLINPSIAVLAIAFTIAVAGCTPSEGAPSADSAPASTSPSATAYENEPPVSKLQEIYRNSNMVIVDDLRGLTLRAAVAKLRLNDSPPSGFSKEYEFTTATGVAGESGSTSSADPNEQIVTAAIALDGKFYFGIASREIVDSRPELKTMIEERAPITVADTPVEAVVKWGDCREAVTLRFGLDPKRALDVQEVAVG